MKPSNDDSNTRDSAGATDGLAAHQKHDRRALGSSRAQMLVLAISLAWLLCQAIYCGRDVISGPSNLWVPALHFLNLLAVATVLPVAVMRRGRKHWRLVLFGSSVTQFGSTAALCVLRGEALPLLTTLVVVIVSVGTIALWRWYWTGATVLAGMAALLVLQASLPASHLWLDYWLIFVITAAIVYGATLARELRRMKRNVARLRRAEKRAREGKAFLRAIFEASPDPIAITSWPDRALIDFNRQYA